VTDAFGKHAPSRLDRLIIAITSRLPTNWLGLRLAIGLRSIVTRRLGGGGLDVDRWGLHVRLHPGDNGCEKNLLYTPQMHEVVEREALAAAIARARAAGRRFVFLDIGANVGLYSLYVASHRDVELDIVAVEPEPGNVERLLFNVGANSPLPIRVKAIALGEVAGRLQVVLNPRDRGGTIVQTLPAGDAAAPGSIPCLPLLDLLEEEGIGSVDALKIDTECTEDSALAPFFRAAPEGLWPRMVIIEDSRHAWRVDVIAMMLERGYAVSARSKHNLVLERAGA
jgi:FkbM family methyltransferase